MHPATGNLSELSRCKLSGSSTVKGKGSRKKNPNFPLDKNVHDDVQKNQTQRAAAPKRRRHDDDNDDNAEED